MRIRDVVAAKPQHTVITVPPTASVQELLALLAQHNVGALVVSKDGLAVEGIVSERDVVRSLHREPDLLSASVESIMTRDVHTCGSEQTVDEMMSVMTERRIRHVPVLDGDGRLSGLVSIGDVVKHRLDEIQLEAESMREYISGVR